MITARVNWLFVVSTWGWGVETHCPRRQTVSGFVFLINMLVAMMILCLGVTSPLYLGQYIHPTLSVPVNDSSVKILHGFALSKKTRINIGVSQNETLFTDFRRYNEFGFTGVSFNLTLQESKLLASLWPVIMKTLDREYLEIAGPRVLSIGEIYNNSLVNNAKI